MTEAGGELGRPSCVKHVPDLPSELSRIARTGEALSRVTDLAREHGLTRFEVAVEVLPAGNRSSSPHWHTHREEFIYVLDGEPSLWLSGRWYSLRPGDSVGFYPGTGEAHMIANRSDREARLLVISSPRSEPDETRYSDSPAL